MNYKRYFVVLFFIFLNIMIFIYKNHMVYINHMTIHIYMNFIYDFHILRKLLKIMKI